MKDTKEKLQDLAIDDLQEPREHFCEAQEAHIRHLELIVRDIPLEPGSLLSAELIVSIENRR